MSTLIKLQIVDLPSLCVVGKQLRVKMSDCQQNNPLPKFWGSCFTDGTFDTVEKLQDFIYDNSYVGWMADWDNSDGYFTYICGMLVKPGCPVPGEGFVSRAIEPTKAAVGWIQGSSTGDVCSGAHDYTQKALDDEGYTSEGFKWCMELYNCPRYTTPDENGNIILDYYIPCKAR